MIVVPAADENPAFPSKVYCIEVAQKLRVKEDKMPKPDGVIIYSVDATIESGKDPVAVHPPAGRDKVNAALHTGETFSEKDAPMSVKGLRPIFMERAVGPFPSMMSTSKSSIAEYSVSSTAWLGR